MASARVKSCAVRKRSSVAGRSPMWKRPTRPTKPRGCSALSPAETAGATVITPIATAVAALTGTPTANASNFAARYGLMIVLIGLGLLLIGLTAGMMLGRRR